MKNIFFFKNQIANDFCCFLNVHYDFILQLSLFTLLLVPPLGQCIDHFLLRGGQCNEFGFDLSQPPSSRQAQPHSHSQTGNHTLSSRHRLTNTLFHMLYTHTHTHTHTHARTHARAHTHTHAQRKHTYTLAFSLLGRKGRYLYDF